MAQIKQPKTATASSRSRDYNTAAESLTVDEKLRILEEIGQPELIELFKGWKPRPSKKKRGAPLDQRVAITVTAREKFSLDQELKSIKSSGETITASQFIRNRALGAVDIEGWRVIATKALKELEELADSQTDMRHRKRQLANLIEETEDPEDEGLYEKELSEINKKLEKLVAKNEKRTNRLSGRMSMAESETVKWRAQRLCLSSSDYLRMMIFGLEPNSPADAHMSLDARRRFYVSILDVAANSWGSPPTVFECSQCANYLDEIEKLRDRVRQLEEFV